MSFLFFFLTLTGPDEQQGLPSLERIFGDNQRAALMLLLSPDLRVPTDLRPMLYDLGYLSRQQVLMTFDKLQERYELADLEIINRQSDTNYAWLEIYMRLSLEDRRSGQEYRVIFGFHFKTIDTRLVISRWVLQDVY